MTCKTCGCSCTACNTATLDLHHEIELLKSQISESRGTINQLKSKLTDQKTDFENQREQDVSQREEEQNRYERLKSSHAHLENVNHDLEDKILSLVTETDRIQEETIEIHTDLHNKLRDCERRIEHLIHEKDTLASHCALAVSLLKKQRSSFPHSRSHSDLAQFTLDAEMMGIESALDKHHIENPIDTPENIQPQKIISISTFPPCAIVVDNQTSRSQSNSPSLKPKSTLGLPRNYSDSRLARQSNHPTALSLCPKCGRVAWQREFGTQTNSAELTSNTNINSLALGRKNQHRFTRVTDLDVV